MRKLLMYRQFGKNQWNTEKCQKTLFVHLKLIFAVLKPWFSIFFLSLHRRTF